MGKQSKPKLKLDERTLRLEQIKPYLNNPRDIRPAIEAVKESIRRFGFHVPLVVSEDFTIITGHARYQAMFELGHTRVAVIVSKMSKELADEYRLVDNRSSEIAMWDRDRLVAELRAIEGDMGPFFKDDELKSLMGDLDKIDTHSVSAATIERTQKELTHHFERLAENMQDRTQFIDCQKCGRNFGFDKDIKGFGLNPHEKTQATSDPAV